MQIDARWRLGSKKKVSVPTATASQPMLPPIKALGQDRKRKERASREKELRWKRQGWRLGRQGVKAQWAQGAAAAAQRRQEGTNDCRPRMELEWSTLTAGCVYLSTAQTEGFTGYGDDSEAARSEGIESGVYLNLVSGRNWNECVPVPVLVWWVCCVPCSCQTTDTKWLLSLCPPSLLLFVGAWVRAGGFSWSLDGPPPTNPFPPSPSFVGQCRNADRDTVQSRQAAPRQCPVLDAPKAHPPKDARSQQPALYQPTATLKDAIGIGSNGTSGCRLALGGWGQSSSDGIERGTMIHG